MDLLRRGHSKDLVQLSPLILWGRKGKPLLSHYGKYLEVTSTLG